MIKSRLRVSLALFALTSPLWPAEPQHAAIANRAPLKANAFNPLPLGAVRPLGWLLRQEQIQADGLTGHLDEFWNDVGPNSGWLGGTGESWERGPYYLDGLLPLAYQLNSATLIAKAQKWIDWTLHSQRADGQFGPAKNEDWWPRMVMLKVLTQYQEVTGDPRVIPFMQRYFAFEARELPGRPLRDWGRYRWQDNVYTVLWLYNRTGDPQLLNLAKLLHHQGYDWEKQFDSFTYTNKETREKLGLTQKGEIPDKAMQTHGVNNAMALKVAPIWWLLSGNESDRTALARQLAMLDRYHGLPNGMFSGDEHFAGRDPSQGIELCAVVESMFSYEEDFAILGDSQLGDRLERVAYNALPGTLSNDMWSHQYDQQPNQIACTRAHRQWSTNGNDSNLFGLEPNFGCCTANLHQGWPKFVSSLWMATNDGGLVVAAYAPSEVKTELHGTPVQIEETTDYPFRGSVRFTVHTRGALEFPLVFRVPGWAGAATLTLNSEADETDAETGFLKLTRTWKDGDVVTLSLPMQPTSQPSYHNSRVFQRGPLVFSLPLEAKWDELKHYSEKSGDWQLTPARPWNFAVEVSGCQPHVTEHPVTSTPFDVQHPAVTLQVEARQLPTWKEVDNSAGPVPVSPVTSTAPLTNLELVPYGAAKLRITAFPYLNENGKCGTR